jgi:hypothetical protein
MARPIDEEVQDLIAKGQVTEVADNKFGKRVRNVDQDPLDVNDEFIIPEQYRVIQAPITAGGDPQRFILVAVTNAVTGVTRNIRFFPNQLAKVVYPIVNGKREQKVKTTGSAALMYQAFADKGDDGMDLAMAALVDACKNGKKIRITAKTPYRTTAYQSTEEIDTNIFTYDLV